MKRLYIVLIFVCLIGLSGCSKLIPTRDTPEPVSQYDSYVIISDAVVMQFNSEFPRNIILNTQTGGTSQVWFDEIPDDVGFIVNTQFYSIDGCPLPGPPIQPGDTVKIAGHLDDESRMIADILWILNNEFGGEDCFGPPADMPVIEVP